MSKRVLSGAILLTILLCVCATLGAIPFTYQQLFPQLEDYPDTQLQFQKARPQLAYAACRLSLIHEQKLVTTQPREVIWSRLPPSWSDGTGLYSSYSDQTHYLKDVSGWRMRSWIHYDSAVSRPTPIYITNSIVLTYC